MSREEDEFALLKYESAYYLHSDMLLCLYMFLRILSVQVSVFACLCINTVCRHGCWACAATMLYNLST